MTSVIKSVFAYLADVSTILHDHYDFMFFFYDGNRSSRVLSYLTLRYITQQLYMLDNK